MKARWTVALAVSVGGHFALASAAPSRESKPDVARTGIAPVAVQVSRRIEEPRRTPEEIASDRRQLVDEARKDRDSGTLDLGRFLLRAGQLDAEERGRAYDLDAAQSKLTARVTALRAALKDAAPPDAVGSVFGDLSYQGEAGGLVADVLEHGGGACEPLSQLVTSTLLAAGMPEDRVALRHYGGGEIAHLAPLVRLRSGAWVDLLTGQPPHPGGSTLAAADLVEVYAKHHQLGPSGPTDNTQKKQAVGASPNQPLGFAGGYPSNRDGFPGALPLYARRAFSPEGMSDAGYAFVRPGPIDCALSLPLGSLVSPTVDVAVGERASLSVEVSRIPSASQLELWSRLASSVESHVYASKTRPADDATQIDNLFGAACLAGLYDRSALAFALRGEWRLSRLSLERKERAVLQGRRQLADAREALDRSDSLRRRRASGLAWALLHLRHESSTGEPDPAVELAFALVTDELASVTDDNTPAPLAWGLLNAMAGLSLLPATRERALSVVATFPRDAQISIMHEIAHAQKGDQPWTALVPLDVDTTSATAEGSDVAELVRVYSVFRRLAWRLWQQRLDPSELGKRLVEDVAIAKLDPMWTAALLDYLVDHTLGLYQHRDAGMEGVDALHDLIQRPELRAAREEPLLGKSLAVLDELTKLGELNPSTLAAAYRAARRSP